MNGRQPGVGRNKGWGISEEGVGEWYFRVGVLKSFPFKKLRCGCREKSGYVYGEFPFLFLALYLPKKIIS